jgi:hypothetical protein
MNRMSSRLWALERVQPRRRQRVLSLTVDGPEEEASANERIADFERQARLSGEEPFVILARIIDPPRRP